MISAWIDHVCTVARMEFERNTSGFVDIVGILVVITGSVAILLGYRSDE